MKDFLVLQEALNKANKTGVFDLNESSQVIKSLIAVQTALIEAEKPQAEVEPSKPKK